VQYTHALSRLCSTHMHSLDCAVHTRTLSTVQYTHALSRLCSTHTHSLDCAVHTRTLWTVQYTHTLSGLCSTHTRLWTVQHTHALSTLCSTHTHQWQICCHNTDFPHFNVHDRTVTVTLAKHCTELRDDGSLVIRNMLEQF